MAIKFLPMALFVLGLASISIAADPIADLSACDFSGRSLIGIDLSGCSLADTYMLRGVIAGGRFVNTNLSRADLTGAAAEGCDFTNADLSGTCLHQRWRRWRDGPASSRNNGKLARNLGRLQRLDLQVDRLALARALDHLELWRLLDRASPPDAFQR